MITQKDNTYALEYNCPMLIFKGNLIIIGVASEWYRYIFPFDLSSYINGLV